jgi:hypothetical protein
VLRWLRPGLDVGQTALLSPVTVHGRGLEPWLVWPLDFDRQRVAAYFDCSTLRMTEDQKVPERRCYATVNLRFRISAHVFSSFGNF